MKFIEMNFTPKTQAVLNHYHQRMEDEVELFKELPEEEKIGRKDGFLLPVGLETGIFLNTLIKSAKSKTILEIGTAYGYSTIWLAEAAKAVGGRVITLEISAEKVTYAKNKMEEAELSDYVEFHIGNALEFLKNTQETFDFVLLDCWKELYIPCFDLFVQNLNAGAYVISDNMLLPSHHRAEMDIYRNHLKANNVFDSVLLPIGSGIEVSVLKNNF